MKIVKVKSYHIRILTMCSVGNYKEDAGGIL